MLGSSDCCAESATLLVVMRTGSTIKRWLVSIGPASPAFGFYQKFRKIASLRRIPNKERPRALEVPTLA
jgi:hypothetical protein